jgi:hypothetical protein
MKLKNLIAVSLLAMAALFLAVPPARAQQVTYVSHQNLLATNGGFGTSANGTWTLLNATTNTTGVANISKSSGFTLYSYFDAMNTNAANSNIVYTAYVSTTNSSATNGYWARASAYDWTNSFSGSSSVSNYISFTGTAGIGYIYWKAAYTGANIATNFVFVYGAKNGL